MNWWLIIAVAVLMVFLLRGAYCMGKNDGYLQGRDMEDLWWSHEYAEAVGYDKVPNSIRMGVHWRSCIPKRRRPDFATTLGNIYTHDFTEKEEVKTNED